MTVAESSVPAEDPLALLRTKGLSIKELDDDRRAVLRAYLERLTNEEGKSLNDVAKLVGNKTSGYASWVCRQLGVRVRPFEEARLKGIREKRRKYERRPFDGSDEDKAYLLGLRHGDLSVSRPFKGAIRVSTSTTHPAMSELFESCFGKYGHIYRHPRFKNDTKSYEWNLSTIVDDSFSFLLLPRADAREWASTKESTILSYLAGILDAEGSVGIFGNGYTTSLQVLVYNTDYDLVDFVKRAWTRLGHTSLGPYLDKEKGTTTSKYRIERKKDYWKVVVARFDEAKRLIRSLPIRHREKKARAAIAVDVNLGDPWANVRPKLESLRRSIKSERDQFVSQAEAQFRATHAERFGYRDSMAE